MHTGIAGKRAKIKSITGTMATVEIGGKEVTGTIGELIDFPERPTPQRDGVKVLMTERYCNLSLVCLLDRRDIEKHGGYHYLITSGATAHTAFRTQEGLERFLKITGLRKKFVRKGERIDSYVLEGCYKKISLAGTAEKLDKLGKRKGLKETMILDNGRYTKAFHGKGQIYYLNVNYPRKEYPYFYE